ncbi:MAG: isopeptide-forming domain-containing fimbrial protein [Tissierellia bacterium]|nr:isopeptide-forming domain-containing fimbrial protein [Tissierellia bacterium]
MESKVGSREKFLSIAMTAIILLLVLVNMVFVTAQGDIEVVLDEPIGDVIVQGSEVKYRLNVKLPSNISNYRSLYITLRLSEGLSLTEYDLKNKDIIGNDVDVMSTAHSDARYSYITIRANDLSKVKDVNSIALDVYAIVNNRAEINSKITNSYSVSYQQLDSSPVSYQMKQESNSRVVGRDYNDDDNVITLVDDSHLSNVEKDHNIQYEGQTPLNILSGRIYADYMNTIKGFTDPGAKVKIKFISNKEEVVEVTANRNGEFTFKIPVMNLNPIIVINAQSANKHESNDYILTHVDERTIQYDDLIELMDNLDAIGRKDLTMSVMDKINETLALTSITLMSEEPPAQMIYESYRDLYFASLQGESMISQVSIVHDPYITGYPEGTFIPEGRITRAEISTIFSRIIANGEVANSSGLYYSDVDSSKWYSKYIAHMSQVGLMQGYDDETFRPEQAVTRAEMATIISRYKNLSSESRNIYDDLDLDFWAAGNILKVTEAGYVNGYPDGTFRPQNRVTRAEAVTMMNRVLERNPDERFIDNNRIRPFSDIRNHWAEYQIIEAAVEHSPELVNGRENNWIK